MAFPPRNVPQPPHLVRVSRGLQGLALALSYALLGYWGQLLSTPPGYLSPIAPAAAVAVAALLLGGLRLWPGILLGSLLLSLGAPLDDTATIGTRTVVTALGVGAGATIQAVVAALLVRRFIPRLNILALERDILPLLLLTGPVACVLSPAIGQGIPMLDGQLRTDEVPIKLLTDWLAETIGVMTLLPLMLMGARSPYGKHWRQHALVTGPVLLIVVSAILLFLSISSTDQQSQRQEFETEVNNLTARTGEVLDSLAAGLGPMQAYFAASDEILENEFHEFSSHLLERDPSLFGLAFAQRVPRERLDDFASVLQQQHPEVRVRPLQTDMADEALIVRYVAPQRLYQYVLGADVHAVPARRKAAEQALRTGLWVATDPIDLIPEEKTRIGVVLFAPVGSGIRDPYVRDGPIGTVIAAVDLRDSLESAVQRAATYFIDVSITHMNPGGVVVPVIQTPGFREARGGFHHRTKLYWAGGFSLDLHYHLNPEHLADMRPWRAWGLVTSTLLFAALLGAVLLILIDRQAAVEALVDSQTQELERSNSDLQRFAAVISHDLKAPLRSIHSFATLIQSDYADQLPAAVAPLFERIRAGAVDMSEMVTALLDLAQVGQHGEESSIDVDALLDTVLETLAPAIREKSATIWRDPLPAVNAVPVEFQQLLQNLIGNALKFQEAGACTVEIRCESQGKHWVFSVRDHGPGIPANQLTRIFLPFQRVAQTCAVEGQGIGLSICQRIVQNHGGRIWVESEPGNGARFRFTWPKR